MCNSPAFTLAAALPLVLGIGANATILSWLNAVVLNPLPGVSASGLMSVRWRPPDGGGTSFSRPDFLDMRGRTGSPSGLAAGSMGPGSLGEGSGRSRPTVC